MEYKSIRRAKFIKRPNRFVAHVILDDREEVVHVKNTGRCREILVEETPVIIEESENINRKYKYSLIGAYKGNTLINIDSQVPNTVIYEAVKSGLLEEFGSVSSVKREVTYGSSRFDIYFETPLNKGFIEVKGVTLEENGIALFPDAPTERGTKHVMEMVKAIREGYLGYIVFLIQMKGVSSFIPNEKTDPDFANALKFAKRSGVNILAYDSYVSENSITIGNPVKVMI